MTASAHRRPWLDRAIAFGPALLLGIAPLVFVRTGGEFENIPKSALLRLGGASLLLLWLLRGSARELSRRVWMIDLPVAAFVGAGLLSLIPAINRYEALPQLYSIGGAVAIYLVISRSVGEVGPLQLLFAAMVASSVVVSAVGISQQLFGLEWIPQAAAPAATFANRNMAAHFVALCVPPALGLASFATRRGLRDLGIGCLMLGGLFLWMTRTHAAWAAVAICLLLAPAALSPRLRAAFVRRRSTLVAYLIAVVLLALVVAIPLRAAADAEGTASLRVIFWKNTLAMSADHPWSGVGLGNFKLRYPLYHRAAAVDWTFDEEHQLAHAHSDHLQYLAETGVPGLLAWLSLFVCGALGVMRAGRADDEAARWAGVAGLLLVVLFVVATFSFPMRRAMPPAYLFAALGVIAALSTRTAVPSEAGRRSTTLRLGAAALTLAFMLSSAAASRHALLREFHYSEGLRQVGHGNQRAAVRAFGRARRQAPFDANAMLKLAGAHIALGEYEEALEPLNALLRVHPQNVNAWVNLGYCHQKLGELTEAQGWFEKAVALLPDSPEAQLWLGGLYFERGDHARAIESYARAVDFARSKLSLPGARSATRMSRPRLALARAYVAVGEYRSAIDEYERVLADGEGTPELQRVLEALRAQVAESEK